MTTDSGPDPAFAASPPSLSSQSRPSGLQSGVKSDLQSISAWPERRPPRTEGERAAIANRFAEHLPQIGYARTISDDDLNAMRAAFIRRFDEQLPRTETLMAVAAIGYRMALRDRQESGK